VLAYGAAAAREYQKHDQIFRQRLINLANITEKIDGPLAALPVYRRILRIYPDNQFNDTIDAKIRTTLNYNQVSQAFVVKAEQLGGEKKDRLAIASYKAALLVWPVNAVANRALGEYREKFTQAKQDISEFYAKCKSQDLSGIMETSDKLTFVINDVNSIKRFSDLAVMAPDDRQRLFLQICGDPLKRQSANDFYDSLRMELFNAAKRS
jgi:hypothetical protein